MIYAETSLIGGIMRAINLKKSLLIAAIVVVLICSVTAVTFAAWSNKLEPTKEFEMSSGIVTHLDFGGVDGIVISDKLEPNKSVSATVNIKSTGEKLIVSFSTVSLKVKFSGTEEYVDMPEGDAELIKLDPIADKEINTTSSSVKFKFTMRQNVDYKYASASFKIVVKAVGVVAAV